MKPQSHIDGRVLTDQGFVELMKVHGVTSTPLMIRRLLVVMCSPSWRSLEQ